MEDPDVDVAVEDDGMEQNNIHPDELVNETPNGLVTSYTTVVEFLQIYGWYVVIGIVLILYVWYRLQPYINKWIHKRKQDDYYQFDADVASRRQAAMERSRRNMQEKLDAQAARYAEEQKIKMEQKRQEKIEDWDRHQQGRGYRSKYKPQENAGEGGSGGTKPRRPVYRTSDYNPLSGGGGGKYHPDRRSGGGGGA